MKQLIVNADDFGLSDETVEATIRCFEAGVIRSATIMAGMRATARAVAYARAHPQFSFGAHLYLVDERPVSPPETIPSLVDPATGRLWPTRSFLLRHFAGCVRTEDILREMRAQYDALAAAGLPISHVDGHGHHHRLPLSIRALQRLDRTPHLRVRRCQDLPRGRLGLLARLINRPMQRRLARAGFAMADHFIMMCGKTDDPLWFVRAVETLPDGITEIGIHPGTQEAWRRIDSSACLEQGADLYRRCGVRLISYNDLPDGRT